jgi:hypothetical protein
MPHNNQSNKYCYIYAHGKQPITDYQQMSHIPINNTVLIPSRDILCVEYIAASRPTLAGSVHTVSPQRDLLLKHAKKRDGGQLALGLDEKYPDVPGPP